MDVDRLELREQIGSVVRAPLTGLFTAMAVPKSDSRLGKSR
jgi:hypothetical protein